MISEFMKFFHEETKVAATTNVLQGILTISQVFSEKFMVDKTMKNALIDSIIAELQSHKDQ